MTPGYLSLHRSGELARRIDAAIRRLESCDLCPRRCGANRLQGDIGVCRIGRRAKVASYSPHFGEETPLVGRHGSGTIFLTSCNLLCTFCQNYDISHLAEGVEAEPEQMAEMMLRLQDKGCHNINFVTPTHVVPQIIEALAEAAEKGLHIPLVYNSSGYERLETLGLLEGVVDIYMPDFKFWDPRWSERYCGAADYPVAAAEAVKEMHRQVGDLRVNAKGIAERGLLVRHLVMPNGVAGTAEIMEFIARGISPDTYVNVMDQYRPCGTAEQDEFIGRRLLASEYREAIRSARAAGLRRLDSRDRSRLMFAI